MRWYLISVLFAVCFVSTVSYAESPRLSNPVFQSLSTKNGLPQDVVNDIAIDADGFVWIATDGGVARWDGVRTKIIKGPNDLFVNASINKISLETDKALWISTYASGVFRLDFDTQAITKQVALPFSTQEDWFQDVSQFFWQNETTLFIGMPEQVVRFDTNTMSYETIFTLSDELIAQRHFIRDIIVVDNWLLLATSDGLDAFDLSNADATAISVSYLNGIEPDVDNLNTKFLMHDAQGRIWLGTVNGLFQTTKGELLSHVVSGKPSGFQRVVRSRNIWTMEQRDDNAFWFGTNEGLFELQLSQNKWVSEHILEPHNGRTELSNKRILDIETDYSGNLWLSSVYAGALYFGVKSAEIYAIQNNRNDKSTALSDSVVWSLAQTDKDVLWIGTENGLNRFNLNTRTSEQFITSDSEFVAEREWLIEKLVPAGDGRLFVQTYMGIRLFDPSTGKLTIPPLQSSFDSDVFNAWNSSITIGADGDLYFVGNHYYRYNLDVQRLDIIDLDEDIFDINFSIGFLGASPYHNNRLFLAMVGGLWLVDPVTLEHELVYRFSEKQRANERSITSWVIDNTGVLWLAFSGYGLFGVDADTFEPLYNLNESNLLLSNIVYGLQKDSNGDIWFSSHSGLHRYSPASAQVQNFIYGRELSVSEFNQGASLELIDGRLAYGSTSGVVVFSPALLKQIGNNSNLISRQTAITDVSVDSRELRLPLGNLNGQSITLDYQDYGMTIHFSSLSMNGVGKAKYHYTLLRNNQVVSDGVSEDDKITLTNLEPGRYRFTVGPLASSVEYNVLPATITFEMPYVPWRSPFAYAAYFTLILLMIIAYVVSRQRHLFRLQKAQQQALLFSDAFRQTRDWVLIFDKNKVPVAANPAFENVFNFNTKESLDKQIDRLFTRYPTLEWQLSGKLSELKGGEFWKDEAVIEGADTKQYDVLIDISAVKGNEKDEQADHYLLVVSDITEQKNAERKLLKLANYDSLTGLVNRSLLLDRLEHAIAGARQQSAHVAVLFVDLDRFKGINDSLGHDYGDKLLKVVANRMRNLASDAGTVARLGGDEFVIVIEDMKTTDGLTSFVAQLIESVETPISLANEVLRVSCSVGIAFYPDDATEPAELIKQADVAMYSAKKDTLSGFTYFTKDMNDRAKQRLITENLIKRAYSEDSFFNYYQPIINTHEKNTVGVELLLRGELDGNPIYPDVFIPVLEELRYIIEVTRAAMRRAAEDLATWYENGFTGFVSINLSALHFKTEFDLEGVFSLLKEFNLPKEAFRFEITEGVLMDDSDNALRQIERFVDAGFILALDDFGTGYSSLSYLKRYPLSVLKIDKSFVDDMAPGNANDALVTTTITLASSLNMLSVAEGVETQEQALSLSEKGCVLHQGYFYAKPMPSSELFPYLNKKW